MTEEAQTIQTADTQNVVTEAVIQPSQESVKTAAEVVSINARENLFDDSEINEGEAENVDYERPDWLPEKFKSTEDLSKSYQELEKKLGSFKGAPEEYKIEVAEELAAYDYGEDNAFVKDFQAIMKEHNVSQELYQKISDCHLNYLKSEDESIQNANEAQYQKDIEELGETGIKEIREATRWAKETLPEESYSLLVELGDYDVTIGKIVKNFYDAFQRKPYAALPTGVLMDPSVDEKKMQAREMMSNQKYGKNELYTQKVDNFYKELYR